MMLLKAFQNKYIKGITKIAVVLLLCLVFSFSSLHKYYVSITQIEYVNEQKAIQITSRIFIDDLESLFKERYDKDLVLSEEKESDIAEFYIEKYLQDKLKININNADTEITYLGKEYENDILFCYLEIENVESIHTIEISNKVLFEKFEDQQNIVRFTKDKNTKSFVLTKDKSSGMLNFE